MDARKEFVIFQSMLPARGASFIARLPFPVQRISIHAPREGSIHTISPKQADGTDFNPCSPRGEHRVDASFCRGRSYFNPCSPRGEHHPRVTDVFLGIYISIHAPREGSILYPELFSFLQYISIHAPREGSILR